MPVHIAHDQRPRPVADLGFRLIRKQNAGPVIDIGEDRIGTRKGDRVIGLAEGMRRGDHFRVGADAIGIKHQHQTNGAARDGNRIFAADIGRKSFLEGLDRVARGDIRRLQNLDDRVEFGLRHVGIRQRNPVRATRLFHYGLALFCTTMIPVA